MKKSIVTLMLAAYCCTAFAFGPSAQDTTRRRQDTSKHTGPKKAKMQKKSTTKKDKSKWDTTGHKMRDTTSRMN